MAPTGHDVRSAPIRGGTHRLIRLAEYYARMRRSGRFQPARGETLTNFPAPPRSETLHRIALLTAVSVLAGLLVAGVALPVVGGLGLATRRGVDQFEKLPTEL